MSFWNYVILFCNFQFEYCIFWHSTVSAKCYIYIDNHKAKDAINNLHPWYLSCNLQKLRKIFHLIMIVMVKYKKIYVACAKTVDIHDILKIVSQFLSSVFD